MKPPYSESLTIHSLLARGPLNQSAASMGEAPHLHHSITNSLSLLPHQQLQHQQQASMTSSHYAGANVSGFLQELTGPIQPQNMNEFYHSQGHVISQGHHEGHISVAAGQEQLEGHSGTAISRYAESPVTGHTSQLQHQPTHYAAMATTRNVPPMTEYNSFIEKSTNQVSSYTGHNQYEQTENEVVVSISQQLPHQHMDGSATGQEAAVTLANS